MSTYDFDHGPDRRGSASVKYARYAGRDVIPMWVADMDWPAPPVVLDALRRHVDDGVFGYALPGAGLVEATLAMLEREYAWAVDPEWLVWLPGLVPALHLACRTFGNGGDVAVPSPIYYPFLDAVRESGCTPRLAPLAVAGQEWRLDVAALAAAVADSRLLLFCNPHNPVGRAYDRRDLDAVATLAEAHDVVVVSDEIHCQLVLDPDRRHLPLATLNEAVAARTITLMAPTKTYNLPGLNCGFAIIPNPELRDRFTAARHGIVPWSNALAYTATEAAYRYGEPWRQELLAYLRGNRDYLEARIAGMPGLAVNHVEATYLAWIDARGLATANPQALFEAGGVGLSDGAPFGSPGYVRLNFGCPRATLAAALDRLAAAL